MECKTGTRKMKILISSTATSYTISCKSLHLRVSFSRFTKQAEKSFLRKAAKLNSSMSGSTERSSSCISTQVENMPVSAGLAP